MTNSNNTSVASQEEAPRDRSKRRNSKLLVLKDKKSKQLWVQRVPTEAPKEEPKKFTSRQRVRVKSKRNKDNTDLECIEEGEEEDQSPAKARSPSEHNQPPSFVSVRLNSSSSPHTNSSQSAHIPNTAQEEAKEKPIDTDPDYVEGDSSGQI